MYIMQRYLLLICALFPLFLSSCATSSLVATWYDENYSGAGALDNVLIIAVTNDETIKHLYEDAFVEKLVGNGIKARPSYKLSVSDIKPDRESLQKAIDESGARALLITRYLGTDVREHYTPPRRTMIWSDPYYSRYNRYYPMAYREVYSPGYTTTVTTVSLESNLYDVRTGKLVWTVRSESVNPSMTRKYVDELVNLCIEDLQKNNIM